MTITVNKDQDLSKEYFTLYSKDCRRRPVLFLFSSSRNASTHTHTHTHPYVKILPLLSFSFKLVPILWLSLWEISLSPLVLPWLAPQILRLQSSFLLYSVIYTLGPALDCNLPQTRTCVSWWSQDWVGIQPRDVRQSAMLHNKPPQRLPTWNKHLRGSRSVS